MKRKLLAASAAILLGTATAACAQPYGGMGPGMMGGYGPGYGHGQGQGYGPGYGPGYGMGPGMMGGYGYGLDLSAEQRAKISEIQQEVAQKRWDLMGRLHQQGGPMAEAFGPGPIDEQSARKAYDAMADAHKQMFDLSLQARKRIEAVLTSEQREQLQRGWRGRGPR